MKKAEHFKREIELIQDEELRIVVRDYLNERVGDWFWEVGASSTGKFHPKFSQGVGGLVRHTKAVVMFVEELLKMSSYAYMEDAYKDYVIAAAIVHDTAKYGLSEKDTTCYKNHAPLAAKLFESWCLECDYRPSEILIRAIRSHMGQWSTDRNDKPFTPVDRCLHMADYMASRSFIDIPGLMEEWENVEKGVDNSGEV